MAAAVLAAAETVVLVGAPIGALAYTTSPNISVSTFVSDLCCFVGSVGPVGMAFDGSGNLFVDDILDSGLYKFGPNGGSAADPTALLNSGFGRPAGLAFSKDGKTLYMADRSATFLPWTRPPEREFSDLTTYQALRA